MLKSRKQNEEKQKQEREQIKKIVQTWRLTKLEKKEVELYEKHILEKKQRLFRYVTCTRSMLQTTINWLQISHGKQIN